MMKSTSMSTDSTASVDKRNESNNGVDGASGWAAMYNIANRLEEEAKGECGGAQKEEVDMKRFCW